MIIQSNGLWVAAVESFDLRYNLGFKIIGVGVGGVKPIRSSDLSDSESKPRNIPCFYNKHRNQVS